ncbi:MAG: hypothetical protein WC451_04020 [Patescibacteria group bacterium]
MSKTNHDILPEHAEEALLAVVRPGVASLYEEAAKGGANLGEILQAMREQSRIAHRVETGVSAKAWLAETLLGEVVWLMWARTFRGKITLWWLGSRQAAGYACSHYPRRLPAVIRRILNATGTGEKWRSLKWGNANLPRHGVEGGATVQGVKADVVRLWDNIQTTE